MTFVWIELQTLAQMYAAAATHFFLPFLAAVVIAALLTTFRLETRVLPFLQRAGLRSHLGALMLGLVSPF